MVIEATATAGRRIIIVPSVGFCQRLVLLEAELSRLSAISDVVFLNEWAKERWQLIKVRQFVLDYHWRLAWARCRRWCRWCCCWVASIKQDVRCVWRVETVKMKMLNKFTSKRSKSLLNLLVEFVKRACWYVVIVELVPGLILFTGKRVVMTTV